jgi:GntR family transcriptional regulator, transcriptional repressor for pyruvate dehydrogenase complex
MANSISTDVTKVSSDSHWKTAPRRTALVDHVVEEVRQAILRGDFLVGSELPSAEKLAETFGVSMTVVREAMRALRSQGLVVVSQGCRPRIAAVDSVATVSLLGLTLERIGSIRDVMQVRWALEVEIAGIAAEHATDEHVVSLTESIKEMLDGNTIDRQIEADVRFHRVLAEATGNPIFAILIKSLETLLRELRRRTLLAMGVHSGVKEHKAILKAIRARDPESARQAMVSHMRLAEKSLERDGRSKA